MTRDQLTDEAEDMLFHTRGMSRREQAVALVNTLFWPELAEARAAALQEAAHVGRKSVMQFKAKFGGYGKYYPGYHEDLREYVAAEIRKLKDPAP